MSKKITLTKNYIVEKSKPLIWSKFSEYNLGEMRLIDTYLAKINTREEESSEVVFTIDEYLRLLGYEYPNKLKSSEIEKSLDKLLGSRIKIDLNNNGDYIKVNLFSDARVIVSDPEFGKRTITIDCNPKLKEAFFGLAEKGYIEYALDYSLRLKSKYSLKLYPLLKDKLYRREWTVELKDLRELMGATNKNNESFREFNKVLQKCKKDINEVTDIEFEYEKITKGRLTRAIKFKIEKCTAEQDQINGQMDIYHFPEYCPDSDPTADPEQNAVLEGKFTLWSEACGNEFNRSQLEELALLAEGHVEYDPADAGRHDLDIYHYLLRKYKSLQNKKDVKSRFGYMKYLVENNA